MGICAMLNETKKATVSGIWTRWAYFTINYKRPAQPLSVTGQMKATNLKHHELAETAYVIEGSKIEAYDDM